MDQPDNQQRRAEFALLLFKALVAGHALNQ
jgi:hypothetical protein